LNCPNCGELLHPIAEVYAREVQREDAPSDRLGRLCPPTSRSAIQGFVLGVLLWMSSLVPFFVVNHFWRACLPLWLVTLIWVPVYLRARKKDARLKAVYEARYACFSCEWIEKP
jgi:hypothetical protein